MGSVVILNVIDIIILKREITLVALLYHKKDREQHNSWGVKVPTLGPTQTHGIRTLVAG